MVFVKTIFIAYVAALASAAPQGATDGTASVESKEVASESSCGNNQKLSCCNSGEDLIGANCLSVPFWGLPLQKACGSNVVACCETGDAEGNFINIELNCLSLPF
ncbi:hypothetical protein MBLNU13_g09119t1 [Cladosporium sp. NU13]